MKTFKTKYVFSLLQCQNHHVVIIMMPLSLDELHDVAERQNGIPSCTNPQEDRVVVINEETEATYQFIICHRN